jgi:hypothetical protein
VNTPTDWLATICVLAALGGGWYLLRRRVDRQQAQLRERLNGYDFIVIEADEVDFLALKEEWAGQEWSYHSASPSADGRTLYRFERSRPGATLLGDILLDASSKTTATDEYRGSPMRIKATGLRSAHAQ